MAKRFPPGRWSFLGHGSETKWYSIDKERPGGKWDRVAQLMMIKFRESGHQVFRATSPLSRGTLKSKGGGKLSFHFCADGDTIETVFRTISPVNQLSICGAVSELCEEYSISFAPADLLIMTPTSSVEILAQENLLQKHRERVENFSQPDQLIQVCIDAGFLKTVEVGQYFGPILEVTTSYLQGKHGVEIRIESVNKDNCHSWVRISHGLNKLVTDLIDKEYDDNEQTTSTTKMEVFAFSSRSKAKAKPRRFSTTWSSTRTVTIRERKWIDIEPGTQSNLAYPVAKRLTTLLRPGQLPKWQEAEATTKDFNTVLTRQEKKFFTFELVKVIQDEILLILHWRTMC